MITISKSFKFDAAHLIPTMPDGHMCRGLHGHTYQADLILRWFDNQFPWMRGFAVDYGEIDLMWKAEVGHLLDHKYLNDVPGLEVPTTEVLAKWIFDRCDRVLVSNVRDAHLLHAVRVYESSTTWCEYKPDAYG